MRCRSEEEATGGKLTLMEMKAGRRRGGRGVDDPGGCGKGESTGRKSQRKDDSPDSFLARLRLKFSGQGSSWCEARTGK